MFLMFLQMVYLKILISNCFLLLCRNKIGVCILISHLATLLIKLTHVSSVNINSSFFVISTGCSTQGMVSSGIEDIFTSSSDLHAFYLYFLSYCTDWDLQYS